MKKIILSAFVLSLLSATPAFALDDIRSIFTTKKQNTLETEQFAEQMDVLPPEPESEFYIFNQKEPMESKNVAVLQSLDKITGRTERFEARVGETVKFGAIYVLPRACQKSSPMEPPEAVSFLQIWEIHPDDGPKWLFSNWMYASSPAISALDHAIYDIWVVDCKNDETKSASEEKETSSEPQSESDSAE